MITADQTARAARADKLSLRGKPAAVAERDAAWQAEATSFSACIFQGRTYVRGDYRTMAEAGAVASFLTRQATNARKAMVYAITAECHATLVPEAVWQKALAEGLAAEDAA